MRLSLSILVFVCVFHVGHLDLNAEQPDVAPVSSADLLEPYRQAAEKKWSKAIDAFDQQNAAEKDPSDAILFVGSSSIRLWLSLETDMSPYPTIRRGYGGAKFTDMAVFANRLISPHQYRAAVMFVANDVTGKPGDHTPDEVESLVRYIVDVSHRHQPGTPFFLIEVTPTESRFRAWPQIRVVNARLREIALSTPDTYFIPTASHFLKPDGTPRPELFVQDRLHLSESGYQLWGSLFRRRLDDVFESTESHAALLSTEK